MTFICRRDGFVNQSCTAFCDCYLTEIEMGTKNKPGNYDCYKNAEPDEPMFILLARDVTAPEIVDQWAIRRMNLISEGKKPESDRAMVDEARECADAMRSWRAARS